MFYESIGIIAIAHNSHSEQAKLDVGGLGMVFQSCTNIEWIAVSFGDFAEGKSSIRFTIAAKDMKILALNIERLKIALELQYCNIAFEEQIGQTWIKDLLSHDESDRRLARITGNIPSIPDYNTSYNWMGKFLRQLSVSGFEHSGICLIFHPTSNNIFQSTNRSGLLPLQQFFTNQRIHLHSEYTRVVRNEQQVTKWNELDTKTTNISECSHTETIALKTTKDGGQSDQPRDIQVQYTENTNRKTTLKPSKDKRQIHTEKTRHSEDTVRILESRDDISPHHFSQDLRKNAIQILNSGLQSGAWWTSMFAFAPSSSTVSTIASLFWSCVSNTSRVLHPNAPTCLNSFAIYKDIPPWEELIKNGYPAFTEKLSEKKMKLLQKVLLRNGLDIFFYRDGMSLQERTKLSLYEKQDLFSHFEGLTIPHRRDILITGYQLPIVLHLPIVENNRVLVKKGFEYCSVGSEPKTNSIPLGWHCPGGIQNVNAEEVHLNLQDLLSHCLVVGSTGVGKSTFLRLLLLQIHLKNQTHICILEGAKREFYNLASKIPLRVFDLQQDFISFNIFEHPPHIAPHTHISQIGALLEACLDLPGPLPSLMREGLNYAYGKYHKDKKQQNFIFPPIQYYLQYGVKKLLFIRKYTGEIGANVTAALDTRISSLSGGAAGKVLNTANTWAEIYQSITQQSILLELESIGDQRSRSFIMSLFVLYYRYCFSQITNKDEIKSILVLEEAHRIIGKTHREENDAQRYFSDMLSEIRAYGCGIVISDQAPSKLIDDAMRNTNTKLIMRQLSSQDIEAAARGAGLPIEACQDIPKLNKFQGILVRSGKSPAIINIAKYFVFKQLQEHIPNMITFNNLENIEYENQISNVYNRALNLLFSNTFSKSKNAKHASKILGVYQEFSDLIDGLSFASSFDELFVELIQGSYQLQPQYDEQGVIDGITGNISGVNFNVEEFFRILLHWFEEERLPISTNPV